MSEFFARGPDESTGPNEPVEPERKHTSVILASLAAAVVIVVAILVPVAVQQIRDNTERRTAVTSREVPDLADVEVYEDLRSDHVDDDVTYAQTPPAGGPHDPVWLDCGVYDKPVRDENAVHDLEHGSVWITYAPDLDEDQIAVLTAALPPNGLLSPYDGLPAPVVVTVWEHQLLLDGANDPRLELFIATYGNGETAPEPRASCAGGIRDPEVAGSAEV